jgi:hypothetical protein
MLVFAGQYLSGNREIALDLSKIGVVSRPRLGEGPSAILYFSKQLFL